jgi:hypothetical protein
MCGYRDHHAPVGGSVVGRMQSVDSGELLGLSRAIELDSARLTDPRPSNAIRHLLGEDQT